MWNALKILKAHPKELDNTLLTAKYSLLYIYVYFLICPQNNYLTLKR